MSKFYAVKEGRIPGVYTSWDECLNQTKGYSGALYKKFNNEEDAKQYVYGMDTVIASHIEERKPANTIPEYMRPSTQLEIKNLLHGIREGVKERDVFWILSKVNDIADLLYIELDPENPMDYQK